ncbi:uncharacterized protein LOC142231468 [Haematobia irritans]|uniref:uncharacterized protein LOC142231468 n=1 Tax=Haematobia irritans TaxID=7368 RepID=UPI003F4FAED7
MKLTLILLLVSGLAITLAEPARPQNGVIHQIKAGVAGPNPYIFLTVPRGRSRSSIQGFEVIASDLADDDDEDDADEDEPVKQKNSKQTMNGKDQDDDDEDEDMDMANSMEEQMANEDEEGEDMTADVMKDFEIVETIKKNQRSGAPMKNAKNTQMMISRDTAGAIMVPEEIIEIEGQSVIDEKTGKPALLLPRSILDSIPDGSVVALMERGVEGRASEEEERANRVIVRRRRKGSRRNVKRGRRGNRRRRRGGKRRRSNRRKNVRVVSVGGNRRRRRGNRRRVVYQG